MYNDIIKSHNFKHIIKLHTKTKSTYEKLTNYLLSIPLNQLLKFHNNINCNCIGDKYINLSSDIYNKELVSENLSKINVDYFFVPGTIFYTTNDVFLKVLEFIKTNNFKCYLLNNLYESNTINKKYSPIHFIERLFGIIKV